MGGVCKIRQRDLCREWPQKAQKHKKNYRMGKSRNQETRFVPFVLFVVSVVSCAYRGGCWSLQHIILAASMSYPIAIFAKGSWMNRICRIIPGSRLSPNPGHPQCFEPASRAAASRPVHPIYPVYPCFLRKEYLIPGRQPGDSNRAAKRRQQVAVGVSPWKTDPNPEPRRRRLQQKTCNCSL